MADCGATGTALDRTVRAMTGNGQGRDAAKALGSMLGQTSLLERQAMPQSAPQTLVMPPNNVSVPEYWQAPQQPLYPTNPAALRVKPPPTAATQAQQHATLHAPPMMMNPYVSPMHAMQQQQQMMIMMNMQLQQQQQHMQMQAVARQQLQQQYQKAAAAATTGATKMEQFWDEQGLDAETKEALKEHLDALHGEEGHEGFVQGAGIEELAAAWAEAEAAYEAEEAAEAATNMASSIKPPKERYIFHNTEAPPEEVMSAKNWMDEGMRHFQEGNVKEAIRCFETQLQYKDNDDSRAWRMLGRSHAENDQDHEAILCLEEAVDRDPYATDALLALAVSHVNELNHQRALESLKAWITHNPNYAGMEMTDDLYGDSAAAKEGDVGVFDEVQRLLLRALEFDPRNAAEILQTLGVVYNVVRDYDSAVDAFRRALEVRPDDYQLWNKLGATLANGSQSEKALPAYNRALELRPRYARAWLNMAISYSNLHNYEEAARCYLQTLSLNSAATHCWSYLRIALSCSEKWDLIPLAASQDLAAFREHYDFVLYNDAPPAVEAD